tara:strand:+ start:520 stop:819 length:300 start_codon:yes stop_codon:yes gene_type:complete
MKRKLWLDDIRHPPDTSWYWVRTYEEVVRYLAKWPVTEISLDHDLGVSKTGYDVACYIEQAAFNNELPPMEWRVHSQNTVGAKNIRAALGQADKFWKRE